MMRNIYEELFREKVVTTIDNLMLATGRPRESILRDLKSIGYYSSYNERGRFYTLESTPEFDGLGLWKYRNAFFSSRRTILDTAEYLVSVSSAGYTHDELRRILGIGIQNSLYQLVTAGRVARQQVGAQYVYFGKEDVGGQWEKRKAMPIEPIARKVDKTRDARGYPDVPLTLVVDVLIAVLRGHETDAAVLSYLQLTGSPAKARQATTVLRFYDIGKKNSQAQK